MAIWRGGFQYATLNGSDLEKAEAKSLWKNEANKRAKMKRNRSRGERLQNGVEMTVKKDLGGIKVRRQERG